MQLPNKKSKFCQIKIEELGKIKIEITADARQLKS